MKYMGSKRAMLQNGLGTLLEQEIVGAKRFIDLFTGSSAVASHVAQNFAVPVLAFDLQKYSVVLADAVLRRQRKFAWQDVWIAWHAEASKEFKCVSRIPRYPQKISRRSVIRCRKWCSAHPELPITAAYGGHYFSPKQAVWIDSLRRALPTGRGAKRVALAALIQAASHCVASPGHTAQPFQPTKTAKRFLGEAWSRDIVTKTMQQLALLSVCKSLKRGSAKKADANLIAKSLKKGDLVFIDPPYSGVHYSRFYHVLESIAAGTCGEVSGVGRYPNEKKRPCSKYSIQTKSRDALEQLLKTLSMKKSKIILTFPDHKCSNGLSGYAVQKIAAKHFHVTRKTVASRFSSLGGTGDNRGDQAGRNARREARELVLTLTNLC